MLISGFNPLQFCFICFCWNAQNKLALAWWRPHNCLAQSLSLNVTYDIYIYILAYLSSESLVFEDQRAESCSKHWSLVVENQKVNKTVIITTVTSTDHHYQQLTWSTAHLPALCFFQVRCLTTSWLMAEWRKRRPEPSSDRSATPHAQLISTASLFIIIPLIFLQPIAVVMLFYIMYYSLLFSFTARL